MEYQFSYTSRGAVAKCSMDHEVFAHWLNTEVIDGRADLNKVLQAVQRCRAAFPNDCDWTLEGREYSLYISACEVMVKSNSLLDMFKLLQKQLEGELEEGLAIYESENVGYCGLEDFERFLTAYRDFIRPLN